MKDKTQAPRVERTCETCGRTFKRRQSSITPATPARFCSRACYYRMPNYGQAKPKEAAAGTEPA